MNRKNKPGLAKRAVNQALRAGSEPISNTVGRAGAAVANAVNSRKGPPPMARAKSPNRVAQAASLAKKVVSGAGGVAASTDFNPAATEKLNQTREAIAQQKRAEATSAAKNAAAAEQARSQKTQDARARYEARQASGGKAQYREAGTGRMSRAPADLNADVKNEILSRAQQSRAGTALNPANKPETEAGKEVVQRAKSQVASTAQNDPEIKKYYDEKVNAGKATSSKGQKARISVVDKQIAEMEALQKDLGADFSEENAKKLEELRGQRKAELNSPDTPSRDRQAAQTKADKYNTKTGRAKEAAKNVVQEGKVQLDKARNTDTGQKIEKTVKNAVGEGAKEAKLQYENFKEYVKDKWKGAEKPTKKQLKELRAGFDNLRSQAGEAVNTAKDKLNLSENTGAQKPATGEASTPDKEPSFKDKLGKAGKAVTDKAGEAVKKAGRAYNTVRHPVRTAGSRVASGFNELRTNPGRAAGKVAKTSGKAGLYTLLGNAAHEVNARMDEGQDFSEATTGFGKDIYTGVKDSLGGLADRYGKMADDGRYVDAAVSAFGDLGAAGAESLENIKDLVSATYDGATSEKPMSQAWREAQAERGFFGRRADQINSSLYSIAGVRNPQAAPTAADPTPSAIAAAPYEAAAAAAAAAAQAQQGVQAPTPTGTTVDPANGAPANAGDQVVIPTGGTAAAVAPTIQTNDGTTDQVGDFTRQRGSFGVRYDDGQGNYMTSKSPGAGGGTVTTIQGMKPGEARAILDRPLRGARAPASASPRFGGGGGTPGLSWGERLAIRNANVGSPLYRDRNLTKSERASQLARFQDRKNKELMAGGIDPTTGVPLRVSQGAGATKAQGLGFKDALAMAKFNRDNAQNAFNNRMAMDKQGDEQVQKMIQGLSSDDPTERSLSENALMAQMDDPNMRAFAENWMKGIFTQGRDAGSGPVDWVMNLFGGPGQTPESQLDLNSLSAERRFLLDNVIRANKDAWGDYIELDTPQARFMNRLLPVWQQAQRGQ